VFLPRHILILRQCLCQRLHQPPLVNYHLCHLLLQLRPLQLQCLYDSLLVRELSPHVLILRLQLAVDLLDIALKLLEPLILPLEVPLQLPQLLLPGPLLLLDPPLVVSVRVTQLLLKVHDLRLLERVALQLEVQDVRDVPDHGSEFQDRVVLVRGEVELKGQVQGLGQLRVRLELVTDVVQEVVGLNREFVVVLLQLLVGVLLCVQLVF
jgi:hypothetical protein